MLGQKKNKLGAFAGAAFHLDFAAMRLDQTFGNGQPQAGSFFSRAHLAVKLLEFAENSAQIVFGDAAPRISHPALHRLGTIQDADLDKTLIREFKRVVHQIGENLYHFILVQINAQGIRRKNFPDFKSFGLRAGQKGGIHFPGDLNNIAEFFIKKHQPRFKLGNIQQPVNDVLEPVHAAQSHGQKFLLIFRGFAVQALKHLQHTFPDNGHGGAEFMRNGAHKLVFHLLEFAVTRNIMDKSVETVFVTRISGPHRKFHGEFAAILVQCVQFHAPVQNRPFATGQKVLDPFLMRLAVLRRKNHVSHCLSDNAAAGPTKHQFGPAVPFDDKAAAVHSNKCVVSGFDDKAGPLLAVPQIDLHAFSFQGILNHPEKHVGVHFSFD